ncbi:hypothetical protein GP486_007793 [Trichoglossum hirsutum]|uniref:Uncharacterized protein n=1 Tax=Trichoglossum hirsutum TaxID=265104 RepID=A0A9P8I5Q1_9PEZI|nr:hypothetical protein GP486_007793 [Trichoglossum hirsutum]
MSLSTAPCRTEEDHRSNGAQVYITAWSWLAEPDRERDSDDPHCIPKTLRRADPRAQRIIMFDRPGRFANRQRHGPPRRLDLKADAGGGDTFRFPSPAMEPQTIRWVVPDPEDQREKTSNQRRAFTGWLGTSVDPRSPLPDASMASKGQFRSSLDGWQSMKEALHDHVSCDGDGESGSETQHERTPVGGSDSEKKYKRTPVGGGSDSEKQYKRTPVGWWVRPREEAGSEKAIRKGGQMMMRPSCGPRELAEFLKSPRVPLRPPPGIWSNSSISMRPSCERPKEPAEPLKSPKAPLRPPPGIWSNSSMVRLAREPKEPREPPRSPRAPPPLRRRPRMRPVCEPPKEPAELLKSPKAPAGIWSQPSVFEPPFPQARQSVPANNPWSQVRRRDWS